MDAALAGLVGAFGGAGIGLGGALKINADQRRSAMLAEQRRAFASFLGAIYPVVVELQGLPPNREPGLVGRLTDSFLGEQASYAITQKQLATAMPQHAARLDRLAGAIALVQALDVPGELASAIDEANDYVERLSDDRTEERKAEWTAIRDRLLTTGSLLTPPLQRRWPRRQARKP